jgi:endonuclease III
MLPSAVLEEISSARRVADYADNLGVRDSQITLRSTSNHLGAVLADAILQAGVRDRTVVRVRVERIHLQFPEAATMAGLAMLIERHGAAEFLLWKHPVKVSRFLSLTELLSRENVSTIMELKLWLRRDEAREHLLGLHGIGPKTYDYLCCLVGIDCIAVDRHVRTFANEAGVCITDYKKLQMVVSYAADLLGMARRDFDAWIWRTMSERNLNERQLSLL